MNVRRELDLKCIAEEGREVDVFVAALEGESAQAPCASGEFVAAGKQQDGAPAWAPQFTASGKAVGKST